MNVIRYIKLNLRSSILPSIILFKMLRINPISIRLCLPNNLPITIKPNFSQNSFKASNISTLLVLIFHQSTLWNDSIRKSISLEVTPRVRMCPSIMESKLSRILDRYGEYIYCFVQLLFIKTNYHNFFPLLIK